MLEGFIKKFVLCPECENPETDLHVNTKKQTIGNSCKAYDYRGIFDTHHKLCTFILKNAPENSNSATGKKEKEKKKIGSETPPPPNEISPPPHAVEEEDDDWGEDTTEEDHRRRMDEISDHAKVLTLSDDLERTVGEHVNILFDLVKKKEEGIIDSYDKEIVAEAERLDVKAMGPLVLTEDLFNEKIREQIKKYRQKASKKYVSNELAKEICVKAEPFIKLLKEAEEESAGGEEEDENIEVVYSKTAIETVKSDKDDDIDIDAI
uniref:Eukaryotic translation initiation factor 5 n=1 Tax=Jaculus jaculus TaxID=51337 RepID=A0A8C5KZB0_JACJA